MNGKMKIIKSYVDTFNKKFTLIISICKRHIADNLYCHLCTLAEQRSVRQKFHTRVTPTRNILLLWLLKWCEERSVMVRGQQKVRTPENVNKERNAILRSPHRSARRRTLVLSIKLRSARRVSLCNLRHRPFRVQTVQELD
jgi:hypothetical protein